MKKVFGALLGAAALAGAYLYLSKKKKETSILVSQEFDVDEGEPVMGAEQPEDGAEQK